MSTSLKVNGRDVIVESPQDTPLLYALRNELGLNGPKFGCGLGQCGACTVLLDGKPALSCVMPLSLVAGRSITTLEGLGTREAPHPLQTAFIESQAMQCGYCANGMIMNAAALLQKDPDPDEQQIRKALAGNLCRCGTHARILRAVSDAAERLREGELS